MFGNDAGRAKNLDSVIIATDDMRIAEAAFDWGAEVALTSPRHQSGTDRVAEVARNAKQFTFVINIQGDEPLIDPHLIDKLVEKLQSDRKIDIVTAAHPFRNPAEASSPHQVKVVVDRSRPRTLFLARCDPLSLQSFADKISCAIRASTGSGATRSPVCEMETESAGARRIAGAIARIGKWCKCSCARY